MGIFDHIGGRPPTTPPATPGPFSVAAVVRSASGPLAGARCRLGSLGPVDTNGDGYAPFNGVLAGTYELSVTCDGYLPYVGSYALAGNTDIPVQLEPAAPVPGPWPATPTRAQVCALQTSLAGLTYHTEQYQDFPAWFYPILSPADRERARADHRAAVVPGRVGGDTHITVCVSEAYEEGGVLWPEELKHGYDWAYDLDKLRAICEETIRAGFLIDMPLAGDGLSKSINPGPGEYNDPVGKTYGYQWLMANFERIAAALAGDGTDAKRDLTKFILFRPGWDGVFYGWSPEGGETPDLQPDRVKKFGELFRAVLPDGYLAIEHTPGNIPCGEGGSDFAPGGRMRTYDTIMSEFGTVHEDSCWQVVGRMVKPYHRPADQPAGDDPNPPFYLAPGTERGEYFYIAFEPTTGGTYEWDRGRCTLAQVNEVREYELALGACYVG